MIASVRGRLVSLDANTAVIEPAEPGPGFIGLEVLVPAYLAEALGPRVGQEIALTTLAYLESHGQSTSFIPRLIGFQTPSERRFFERFTSVKGLGNRKALRALALTPSAIAGLIVTKDARGLQRLPEVGKRLAETIIAELSGKVEAFLSPEQTEALDAHAGGSTIAELKDLSPAAREAVAALMSLGENAGDAERMVRGAMRTLAGEAPADEILSAAFHARSAPAGL